MAYEHDPEIHVRSGSVTSTDPFVVFVYVLLRDHLPAGELEHAVQDAAEIAKAQQTAQFSNGWLASYAEDAVRRIRGSVNDH